MLPVDDALDRILTAAKRQPRQTERLSVPRALNRILAADLHAPMSLPRHDNSAMDGYAVRIADLPGRLPVAGTVAAGDAPGASLAPATTWQVMTGAPLPSGAEAVVMREEVDEPTEPAEAGESPRAGFEGSARAGQNIRRRGEDIAEGELALAAGMELGPGELGLLAALEVAEIEVGRRPRVWILSTGTELVDLGTTPGPGQKVNSNAVALAAQIESAGGEVVGSSVAADDLATLERAFGDALGRCDVLLTSGGVSAGNYDYGLQVASACGVTIDFWKVAIKPGKPMAFGAAEGGCLYFGLPGNPVSTMVTFELFVRPAIRALAGASDVRRPRAIVEMTHAYRKRPGRAHYLRARLERRGARLLADAGRDQGSGRVSSMAGADALIEVDAESGGFAAGDQLPALLLKAR